MMAYYLNEYGLEGSTGHRMVDQLLREHSLSAKFYVGSGNIDSKIVVFVDGKYTFRVAEYPGNCSTLVLYGVQSLFQCVRSVFELALSFTEELVNILDYGALQITVTDEPFRDYLISKGFEVKDKAYNPHSGRTNYFLSKLYSQPEV